MANLFMYIPHLGKVPVHEKIVAISILRLCSQWQPISDARDNSTLEECGTQ